MADRRKKASDFAQRWRGRRGSETSETREFWEDLLENVLDVSKPYQFIQTEKKVKIDDHNRRIDVYIPKTKVLIEQKDKSISLDHKGPLGTAYEQARLYESELPLPEKPKWIITCNFKEFRIYDRVHPNLNPVIFALEELPDNIESLEILANEEIRRIVKEERASIKAAEIISKLYNSILDEYKNPTDEELDSLNIFCVRLAFCMYLEDAGVFNRDSFQNLVEDYMARPWDLRDELFRLFDVLDTPVEDRDKYLPDNLKHFPYVDGELFSQHNLIIPQFTKDIVKDIYEACKFGWEEISPAIFGAAYESTINPETRSELGMHYTSQENIHKVIDPLFLDDLKAEVEEALNKTVDGGSRTKAINSLRNKLADLQFLDPACGSGNFLTETFIELRRLENILIAEQVKRETEISNGVQITAGFEENIDQLIRVKLDNFHGIEIQPFAVAVARTSLWIAEIKMKKETNELINTDSISVLPLRTKPNIHRKNALRIDWNDIVNLNDCDYIIGNPPYKGSKLLSDWQKADMSAVFPKNWKRKGELDYIAAFFKKAFDYIKGSKCEVAFVSTSSIVQGVSPEILWEPLIRNGLSINYAYLPFIWINDTQNRANVWCVIISFSDSSNKKKFIIDNGGTTEPVKKINGYLMDLDNIYLARRKKTLCNAPKIGIGNKPIDDGNYLFKKEEMEEFLKKEPKSKKYFRPWYGTTEFLSNSPRYCLWLGDITPDELTSMPKVKERVQAVYNFRINRTSPETKKLAKKPTHFHVENMPNSNYIVIPELNSENRNYIIMGFLGPENLCSNLVKISSEATLYHFGVLSSKIHMIWVKTICGRLGNGYRYSKEIVYNNFPWPTPTHEQKSKIEEAAKSILDARALFPNVNLREQYKDLFIYTDLQKAHDDNDKAVMEAYGFDSEMTEDDIFNKLMERYVILINEEKN